MNDRQFIALGAAYRESGGAARGDDLARLLEDNRPAHFISLGHLIATGEIFGFEWNQTIWVPMFQFDLRDLSIKPNPRQVVAALRVAFDGWHIARWFVMRHAALRDRRPIELLDREFLAVLEAARADALAQAEASAQK